MKKPFMLPTKIRFGKNALVARMSQMTVQAEDSEKRVLAATRSLQRLQTFLRESKERVP